MEEDHTEFNSKFKKLEIELDVLKKKYALEQRLN